MQGFILQITDDLFTRHGASLADMCVVFPNRRAGLFFRQHLASLAEKPIWSPDILTINEFFFKYSDAFVPDRLTLTFELFNVFKRISKTDENFDTFYFWGDMLLRDFDEIDKYLIRADDIYENLYLLKEIENRFDYLSDEQVKLVGRFWSTFNEKKMSEHQKKFLDIWKILAEVYSAFKGKLKDKHYAYEGMVYREVAEKLTEAAIHFKYPTIVFAGFNALNKCEQQLFGYLKKEGLAEFYWDADEYMLNPRNEAGLFVRENIRKYPSALQGLITDNFRRKSDKNITVVSTAMHTGQAKTACRLLNQLTVEESAKKADYRNTAVVLPDEHMLFPVLHSIPGKVSKLNVTMGYPLRNTPLYSLVEHLINLQQRARQSSGKLRFYYRDILAILRHPYVLFRNADAASKNIRYVERYNRIYITTEELPEKDELFEKLFVKIEEVNELFDYLLNLLYSIHQSGYYEEYKNPAVEQEFIYQFYTQIKRLGDVIRHNEIEIHLDTFWKLFRQLVNGLTVPFTGEPLEGLQIMGTLETRCLDFENVFILSMNEGIFPKSSAASSFIPFSLRKGFGMPTIDQLDAIYAYYFYSIIQRAQNVYLFYNTASEGIRQGEMSRYIYQLKYESPFDIREMVPETKSVAVNPKEMVIEKTGSIMALLKEKYLYGGNDGQTGLTPSAINSYLDCRLRFYFRYVAGLKEEDEVQEEVDALIFGNILHNTMEKLYKSLQEKKGSNVVDKGDFGFLHGQLDKFMNLSFSEYYGGKAIEHFKYEGRNIVVREIIKKYIKKILEYDEQYTPFEIVGLEAGASEGYTVKLLISIDGSDLLVKLEGVMDRIDKKDNVVRILDYKSGADEKRFSSISSLFDREDKKRNKAALQTLYYGLLYEAKHGKNGVTLNSGLMNVKAMFGGGFDYRLEMSVDGKRRYEPVESVHPLLDEFRIALKHVLEELFDPHEPFRQTEDHDKCAYCSFVSVCHRDL